MWTMNGYSAFIRTHKVLKLAGNEGTDKKVQNDNNISGYIGATTRIESLMPRANMQ